MRLRDAKVGQIVKIKLAKDQIGIDHKFSGRIGTVQKVAGMISVFVAGIGTDYFYPREIQLKKGRKK